MNISAIRKKINFLEQQRKKTLEYLLHPKEIVCGSIYSAYKKCGNKNCRCARGNLHGPFNYLSKKVDGKTKLTFIRRADEDRITTQAQNYRKYIKAMAKLNKLNSRIYENIKKIKEEKTGTYERRKV